MAENETDLGKNRTFLVNEQWLPYQARVIRIIKWLTGVEEEEIRRKCKGKDRKVDANYQGYRGNHSEEQNNENQHAGCDKEQEAVVNETGKTSYAFPGKDEIIFNKEK